VKERKLVACVHGRVTPRPPSLPPGAAPLPASLTQSR
jgi:hypothetical protein